jgi:hypothetical protein
MAGAHFDERFATLLSVNLWVATAALEQADRKSLRPESLLTRITFFSIADIQF